MRILFRIGGVLDEFCRNCIEILYVAGVKTEVLLGGFLLYPIQFGNIEFFLLVFHIVQLYTHT